MDDNHTRRMTKCVRGMIHACRVSDLKLWARVENDMVEYMQKQTLAPNHYTGGLHSFALRASMTIEGIQPHFELDRLEIQMQNGEPEIAARVRTPYVPMPRYRIGRGGDILATTDAIVKGAQDCWPEMGEVKLLRGAASTIENTTQHRVVLTLDSGGNYVYTIGLDPFTVFATSQAILDALNYLFFLNKGKLPIRAR